LFRATQFHSTQLTIRSAGPFGSKSIPACGAVPAVSLSVVLSIRRFSAVMTQIPCR
jgi:hypothetical protein